MRKSLSSLVLFLVVAVGSSTFLVPRSSAQDRDRDRDQAADRDHDNKRNDRDHDRDARWTNNNNYQQGLREGFEDHDKHHKRKRPHFDNRDDRDAYNAGYNHGWKGDEQYRPR